MNKNVNFESNEELHNLTQHQVKSKKRARTAFGIKSSSSNLLYGKGTDEKSANNSRERSRKRAKPRFLH